MNETREVSALLRGWPGGVAALLAGAAWPFAFAPWGWYPLTFVCLALLFFLWRGAGAGSAFRRGYLFGLGAFGAGVNWVYISMHDYGGMGPLLAGFVTALLVVSMALFPAFAGLLAVRLASRRAGPARHAWMLSFPAAWMLLEWVRGWFLTGFPWLHLGYSQIDAPLAGYAPLLGVYGVSLFGAVSAALALAALTESGRPRRVALAVFALLWLGGAALGPIEWTRSTGEPLRVSLVQGNVPQDLKWHPAMRDITVELYARLTRAHWDSDLVIWPETAMPMYYAEARSYLEALAEEAAAHDSALLVGLVYLDPETRRYYNSMVDAARHDAIYHKRHLVPFTEYLPAQSVLGGFIDAFAIPMSDFSAGLREQPPIAIAGQRLGVSICFEDAFGEEIIRDLPEATLLVNVSNDAWFNDSAAPHQHLQIARMRALETGRYMARATNTGMTAFIDARGEVLSVAPQFVPTVLTGEVEPRTGATPYVVVGNAAAVAIALLLLLAAWVGSRQSCGAGREERRLG